MKALVFLLAGFTVACSIYQSPGRKYLEQNSYAFAGVAAQPNLLGCDPPSAEIAWQSQSKSEETELYGLDTDAGALRVNLASPEFGCEFRFSGANERQERTADAIALTKSRASETK